jgi:hypothetical protein
MRIEGEDENEDEDDFRLRKAESWVAESSRPQRCFPVFPPMILPTMILPTEFALGVVGDR